MFEKSPNLVSRENKWALWKGMPARVIARSTMHEMPPEESALPRGGDVFRKM